MDGSMLHNRRCPRCGDALFHSEDPLDPPGTTYCLAGHTFFSHWSEPSRMPGNRPVLRGLPPGGYAA